MGYYIPYIYVTNDSALAAGREVIGTPKKLAHIGILKENDMFLGYLERPKGKRLVSISVKPEQRISDEFLEPLMRRRLELYSLRLLPPSKAGISTACSMDCIHGYPHGLGREVIFDNVRLGKKRIWGGSASVAYDSPSISDPVHKIKIGDLLLGAYLHFDMALKPGKVVKEWKL